METSYVTGVDGAYRITGSRVSLDSVVYDFLSGFSPESIADNYDTLTLEQVYGAITHYLAHVMSAQFNLMIWSFGWPLRWSAAKPIAKP